ncbi:hypothetical protein ACU8MP_33395 (plasmid) [Rhizobium leguminosarum]|uniref:hypothetical protein n=1 Tax=Rhizobium leguminosarum TaxID=384 RepID=UPI0015F99BA7|nr:hypothetical protein [Rhizobium leguminosarum]MBA9034393.1 hypothetical protein [Rhizobium leguminosarum]
MRALYLFCLEAAQPHAAPTAIPIVVPTATPIEVTPNIVAPRTAPKPTPIPIPEAISLRLLAALDSGWRFRTWLDLPRGEESQVRHRDNHSDGEDSQYERDHAFAGFLF